jgi:metal iron transporter
LRLGYAAVMNCPSRADPIHNEGWNQNPDALNADATTRADLNHMANARLQRDHRIDPADDPTAEIETNEHGDLEGDGTMRLKELGGQGAVMAGNEKSQTAGSVGLPARRYYVCRPGGGAGRTPRMATKDWSSGVSAVFRRCIQVLRKYSKFIGPGFMVAVAYIDPGRRPSTFSSYQIYLSRCLPISMSPTKHTLLVYTSW